MKIKGKGVVRMEQITCRALLWISVIAFGLCLMMEYFLPIWIDEYYFEFLHLDFLENVMLGISGSSVISYVCVIFPYMNKKNIFIKTITQKVKHLYRVCNQINENLAFENNNSETYLYEISLFKDAKDILDEIYDFVLEYQQCDWTSQEIDIFALLMLQNVVDNLNSIMNFVSLILPAEFAENPLEAPRCLKKDIIIKRANNEIHKCFKKGINQRINISDFYESSRLFNYDYFKATPHNAPKTLDKLYRIKTAQLN